MHLVRKTLVVRAQKIIQYRRINGKNDQFDLTNDMANENQELDDISITPEDTDVDVKLIVDQFLKMLGVQKTPAQLTRIDKSQFGFPHSQ